MITSSSNKNITINNEALMNKLFCKNVHQIPKVSKIVINCCIGSQSDRKQAIEDAIRDLTLISGQKPITTKAKNSISNFKLRESDSIGLKVTLRGKKMNDFLLRLIKIALPKIRDFRGISPKSFDGRGNYTFGINDQSIFPEIELEKIKRVLGFDVSICTTATSDVDAYSLLREMGMPFKDLKN